jgi:hypothetical protein
LYNRDYEVYVILGDPSMPALWTRQGWPAIVTMLDPLIVQARGPAAVRSFQLRFGNGSPNERDVSFGRIGWNKKGHEKWTHENSNGLDREFCDVEVWAPSWSVCYHEDRAPEFFFKLENEDPEGDGDVVFNPVITLAVALDQGPEFATLGRKTAEVLALHVRAVFRGHRKRRWGYTVDLPEYEERISDMRHFRIGPPQKRPVDMSTFEHRWDLF